MFINLKAKSQIVWEKLNIQERMKIIYVQDSRITCGILWAEIFVIGKEKVIGQELESKSEE